MLLFTQLESSFVGVTVDTELNMSQQHAPPAKAVNSVLVFIRRSAASKLREVILPLYSPLERLNLECQVQFLPPQ